MTTSIATSRPIGLRLDQWCLALVFCGGLIFYSILQLHHDVAWYAYGNLRQLEGMKPYVDIIEVSPPIAFYLTLLPVAVASWTGLSINFCVAFFVLSLTAFSLWLAMNVDRDLSPEQRRWRTVAAAALLVIIPIAVFAQREHFTILLGLPYFYICAARLSGRPVSWRTAIVAGLMAGIGLSIKHYFLLAPLMVEIYLMIARRSFLSPWRPEILGAVISGSLYTAAVVIAYPEYLTVSVPLILAAYESYSRPIYIVMLLPWSIATLGGIALWLTARARIRGVPSADILFVAAAAFYLCVLWQSKGWPYHSLPANLMLALAALEMVTRVATGRVDIRVLSGWRRWVAAIAPIALILSQTIGTGPYRSQFALDAAPYVEKYAPGGAVYFMSSNLSTGFPLVLDTGTIWASRFATQWLLPDVIRGRAIGDRLTVERREQLAWVEKVAVDTTIEDFEKFQPRMVFVDRAYQDRRTILYGGVTFNMIDYFNQNERFAKIWSQYEKVETLSTYLSDIDRLVDIWVLKPAN